LLQHKPSSTPCLEIFPCNLENKPTQQITSKISKSKQKHCLIEKTEKLAFIYSLLIYQGKWADVKSESNPVS
jgi:hypothetical protein